MSSERSEALYDIYLCSYYDQSSPVSRHYTTGYSICRRVITLTESDVNTILSSLKLDVQRVREEVVITDITALNTIIKVLKNTTGTEVLEEPENAYMYIVFKKKQRS